MGLYLISNEASGHVFGYYEGTNETEATAAMLRDAGYAVTIKDGGIVFPRPAPESARNLSDLVVSEDAPSIKVRCVVDRYSIGDASGKDKRWQKRVCKAISQEIHASLTALHPEATVNLDVEIGSESKSEGKSELAIETDYPVTQAVYTRLCEEVQSAQQRGFDKACGG